MNTPINNGGSAFPSHESPSDGWLPSGGMSLRDYFAAKALEGWIANAPTIQGAKLSCMEEHAAVLAIGCYTYADAMLKAREQSQP